MFKKNKIKKSAFSSEEFVKALTEPLRSRRPFSLPPSRLYCNLSSVLPIWHSVAVHLTRAAVFRKVKWQLKMFSPRRFVPVFFLLSRISHIHLLLLFLNAAYFCLICKNIFRPHTHTPQPVTSTVTPATSLLPLAHVLKFHLWQSAQEHMNCWPHTRSERYLLPATCYLLRLLCVGCPPKKNVRNSLTFWEHSLRWGRWGFNTGWG